MLDTHLLIQKHISLVLKQEIGWIRSNNLLIKPGFNKENSASIVKAINNTQELNLVCKYSRDNNGTYTIFIDISDREKNISDLIEELLSVLNKMTSTLADINFNECIKQKKFSKNFREEFKICQINNIKLQDIQKTSLEDLEWNLEKILVVTKIYLPQSWIFTHLNSYFEIYKAYFPFVEIDFLPKNGGIRLKMDALSACNHYRGMLVELEKSQKQSSQSFYDPNNNNFSQRDMMLMPPPPMPMVVSPAIQSSDLVKKNGP